MAGHEFLDPIEPRLRAAFALRLRARGVVPRDEDGLLRFARAFATELEALAAAEGWRAEPPFLGRTRGIERLGETLRLVAVAELRAGGVPLGVVFTTLIGGRRPEIAIAPPA